MDEINTFFNELMDLTISANNLPRDFDFRFKMLDDDFSEKINGLSEKTLNIVSQLSSYILSEPVEPNEEAATNAADRSTQILLNSRDLDILDKNPTNQIQGSSVSSAVTEVEHCQAGDFEVFYSKVVPKPPKFIMTNNMDYQYQIPIYNKIEKLPIIVNVNPPEIDPATYITNVFDIGMEISYINQILQAFPTGPLFVACQNHRIRTYRPYCSLLLVMTPQFQIYIFDILKLRQNLMPIRNLMANKNVTKIMYDAQPDINVLTESHGIFISPLVDICTVSDLALEDLIPGLKKCVVDWRIRPLTSELLSIAAQSVWHLPKVASEKLNTTDPQFFINREVKLPKLPYIFGPDEVKLAVEEIEGLVSDQEITEFEHNTITELAKWRDSIAVTEEESPHFIATDQALLTVAKEKPQTPEELMTCLDKMMTPHMSTYSYDILLIVKNCVPSEETNVLNLLK